MNVTYIGHSGFSIELNNIVLLFDYFKGTIPDFNKDKKVVVFSSHKHQDHFQLSILDLAKKYSDILFIFSKDIRMNVKYMDRKGIPIEARDKIHYIGKNELANIDNISIETLTSTDEGVAFIVNVEEKNIYHAGDLNWWSWAGETEDEYEDMTSRFIKEMEKLKNRFFDLAFVPLDPRQDDRFWWGFDYFMKVAKVNYIFPMHFWDDFTIIKRFKTMEYSLQYRNKIIDIEKEGQKWNI